MPDPMVIDFATRLFLATFIFMLLLIWERRMGVDMFDDELDDHPLKSLDHFS
jgi:hypothetical protein